ncbi:FtsW/RodA/SpoVE family cell cycle protein [Sutcliffiella rhizosphaerae]|uniref:Peptidoglycan glycosyltransferase MrdB n=1 Tax=Sutcliffiella rhizosphaerae TaxID=2880967 RepID=A0ABM8YMZ2_9BACI|nr:FtsW/RodA/SpoVE family cell cycle protein [Sutcliffiella rhizosphaerae]CAG9621322.1 Peptidoglycan glycosyltransferase MrdB [Sutcliffiella rhizosphaerae]
MNKSQFLFSVTQWIKSKEAKALVEKELSFHLQIKTKEYALKGFSTSNAESKAIKEMGNPTTIGKKFNHLYRPMIDWSIIGVFVFLLLAGFILLYLLEGSGYHLSWSNKITYVLIGLFIAGIMMFLNYESWLKYRAAFLIMTVVYLLFLTQFNERFSDFIWFIDRPFLLSTNLNSNLAIPLLLIAVAGFLAKPLRTREWLFLVISLMFSFALIISLFNVAMFGAFIVMIAGMLLYRKMFKTIFTFIALFSLPFVALPNSIYHRHRILAMLEGDNYAISIARKILMEASWYPKGLSEDTMLPHTDFAALTIVYGTGYIISLIILGALLFLIIKALKILKEIKSEFGRLLIVGSTTLFAYQLFYNLGMVIGVLPLMSVPLPFLSYGFLPILLNAIFIGILLSTYRRKNFIPTNI